MRPQGETTNVLRIRWELGFLLLLAACTYPIPISATPGPSVIPSSTPPYSVSYFGTQTSGNLAYTIGTFVSGTCHRLCSYQLSTTLPTGYEQAEIFLTGWQVENLGGTTPLHKLLLSSMALGYNSARGKFDWEAAADVRSSTNFGDEYRFTLHFSILLTKPTGAQLTVFKNGCSAVTGGRCHGRILIPNILPARWEFVALGVRRFQLEAGAGTPANGILLNRLALNINQWRLSGTDLDAPVECEMFDATPTEPMACVIEAVAITTALGETFHVRFASGHTSTTFFGSSGQEPPPRLPVDGGFGGFDRFLLTYGAGQEAKVWSWAADYVDILICPNMIDFCYHRIGFLGDTFGSRANVLTFDMEISGFGIWTRP